MDEKHEGKEANKKEKEWTTILFTELERGFPDHPVHIAVPSPYYKLQ